MLSELEPHIVTVVVYNHLYHKCHFHSHRATVGLRVYLVSSDVAPNHITCG